MSRFKLTSGTNEVLEVLYHSLEVPSDHRGLRTTQDNRKHKNVDKFISNLDFNSWLGRAMSQAVSRRPLTVDARVRSRVSPCGICGGQSGTGTGFFPITEVFPCQFHSTGAPLFGKTNKLIIFITELHDKHLGCSASVASAAGPFTTKNWWLKFVSNLRLHVVWWVRQKWISLFRKLSFNFTSQSLISSVIMGSWNLSRPIIILFIFSLMFIYRMGVRIGER
jgi:hypothetical protein